MIRKILLPFAAGVIVMLFILLFVPARNSRGVSWSADKQKKYISALTEKGMYAQAVLEYQKLLDSGSMSQGECANLSYMIGNIYLENLRDYESALAAYLKVAVYNPRTKLEQELNQKIIECLERTGRSFEAQKEMDRRTLLDKPKEISKSVVVARIGKREITMSELEDRIRNLPAYIQKLYQGKEKQLEFLKQYVAAELLYDAAKRRNYENDREMNEQLSQMKKSLMVGKLMQEEARDKTNVTDYEVKLYYDAHKAEFTEKGGKEKKGRQLTLEEAREKVTQALRAEKEQEAQQELISKLFAAEKTEIYENLFIQK